MKRFFLLPLLLCSCLAYCQLSNDSLKTICIEKYRDDILKSNFTHLQNEIKNGNLSGKADELFEGYFNNTKVFLVNHKEVKPPQWIIDDDPNVYPRLYAVDIITGRPADLKNYTAFNNFINTANKQVANVDKCYLYLFLNGAEPYSLTSPEFYRAALADNSVFSKEAISLFKSNCGTCQWPKPAVPFSSIKTDIAKSVKKNIKIYLIKQTGSQTQTSRYTFVFDKRGNINDVLLENIVGVSAE